jgi:GH35 family endo-1,4-beta-xylanase
VGDMVASNKTVRTSIITNSIMGTTTIITAFTIAKTTITR